MNESQITSWQQFVQIANALDVGAPELLSYAFRGQADSRWDLTPAFTRKCCEFGLSEDEALRIEKLALAEFRSQAHLHLSANVLSTTTDTISWWSLMQHHGAPTRLLDWCESAYVAAYFAVTGNPRTAGAVWLVHIKTVHDIMAQRYQGSDLPTSENQIRERFLQSGAPPAVVFCSRLSKTERMVAQQGVFSVSRNVLGNHGQILADSLPGETQEELFRKLVIPADMKPGFLRKLRALNITANSLFPGLDGLGRSIDELVQAAASHPSGQEV